MRSRPVAICVPARDEADALASLVVGLSAQRGVDPSAVTLCLLLDNCRDDSAGRIATLAARAPFRIVTGARADGAPPNAGVARRHAMALGIDIVPAHGALLTTDADSAPDPDWIAAALRGLEQADIVAGRIVRDAAEGSARQDRLEAYYDRLYALRRRLDPVPWEDCPIHHYTAGASLAFRRDAYLACGGFAPVPSGEDGLIVDEAMRAGLRVRRDGQVVVHTSSRRVGRAPGGLAAALRHLDGVDPTITVAHPRDEAWRYALHARARAAFDRPAPDRAWGELAEALAVPRGHLEAWAVEAPNGEAFATRVVPSPPGGMRHVPLDAAEAALALLEARRLLVAA